MSELFIFSLMSACHSLRLHTPFKKVFNKLGDSYQTYINMYKTQAMAIHQGGTWQSLEKDPNLQEQGIDIPNDYQNEEMDDLQNLENENQTWLRDLTNELDHLWYKVEATESQPTEDISHLECELHRLSLALYPSALPEPIDEVLQQ